WGSRMAESGGERSCSQKICGIGKERLKKGWRRDFSPVSFVHREERLKSRKKFRGISFPIGT
ncbi:hypothetical protein, partial [uncultured Akkermansia sp.]|uniref:hypothetical protein n=1 Tax=uncultured Akkermansia sp. TaxID=512294 RepID=UPI00263662F4